MPCLVGRCAVGSCAGARPVRLHDARRTVVLSANRACTGPSWMSAITPPYGSQLQRPPRSPGDIWAERVRHRAERPLTSRPSARAGARRSRPSPLPWACRRDTPRGVCRRSRRCPSSCRSRRPVRMSRALSRASRWTRPGCGGSACPVSGRAGPALSQSASSWPGSPSQVSGVVPAGGEGAYFRIRSITAQPTPWPCRNSFPIPMATIRWGRLPSLPWPRCLPHCGLCDRPGPRRTHNGMSRTSPTGTEQPLV